MEGQIPDDVIRERMQQEGQGKRDHLSSQQSDENPTDSTSDLETIEPTKKKSKAYRLQSTQLFLTYPKCPVPKEDALEQLQKKVEKWTLKEYIIAEEKHQVTKSSGIAAHSFAPISKGKRLYKKIPDGWFDESEERNENELDLERDLDRMTPAQLDCFYDHLLHF